MRTAVAALAALLFLAAIGLAIAALISDYVCARTLSDIKRSVNGTRDDTKEYKRPRTFADTPIYFANEHNYYFTLPQCWSLMDNTLACDSREKDSRDNVFVGDFPTVQLFYPCMGKACVGFWVVRGLTFAGCGFSFICVLVCFAVFLLHSTTTFLLLRKRPYMFLFIFGYAAFFCFTISVLVFLSILEVSWECQSSEPAINDWRFTRAFKYGIGLWMSAAAAGTALAGSLTVAALKHYGEMETIKIVHKSKNVDVEAPYKIQTRHASPVKPHSPQYSEYDYSQSYSQDYSPYHGNGNIGRRSPQHQPHFMPFSPPQEGPAAVFSSPALTQQAMSDNTWASPSFTYASPFQSPGIQSPLGPPAWGTPVPPLKIQKQRAQQAMGTVDVLSPNRLQYPAERWEPPSAMGWSSPR
eukprot:TRINITY_DN63856_c0_g1_i2.p2 TRINITY_DN63856_c0_g1~~TRINITY_DN63856_c0_g1_i2.p2  ORF type:complete len:411 (+),score=25.69 TRINITY_DN63856_c0_g1_i2:81-1313(+)